MARARTCGASSRRSQSSSSARSSWSWRSLRSRSPPASSPATWRAGSTTRRRPSSSSCPRAGASGSTRSAGCTGPCARARCGPWPSPAELWRCRASPVALQARARVPSSSSSSRPPSTSSSRTCTGRPRPSAWTSSTWTGLRARWRSSGARRRGRPRRPLRGRCRRSCCGAWRPSGATGRTRCLAAPSPAPSRTSPGASADSRPPRPWCWWQASALLRPRRQAHASSSARTPPAAARSPWRARVLRRSPASRRPRGAARL
mmetsp:Transcript_12597/g.39343  ORF Transcript_12597/g.39343 Transcript_12597/m.39343 type:complete len:260 (+) Transcript_12597:125-904(+)